MEKEHKHKIVKHREDYINEWSYDDELDIVYDLLHRAKKIEKEITKDFLEALEKLWEVYKEQFPFYYKADILNKNELQKLFLSLQNTKSLSQLETKLSAAIKEFERKTEQLQQRKMLSYFILAYELTSQKTAASLARHGFEVTPQKMQQILEPHKIEVEVTKPWCNDNQAFLDRIAKNCRSLETNLKQIIYKGIKEGWTFEKMSKALVEQTGIAAYKAARLIRTETMAVYAKATKETMLAGGVEYVEIIGDAECGGICLDYVGEGIPLREAMIGLDLPPYHPNCACSFCTYIEDEEIEKE